VQRLPVVRNLSMGNVPREGARQLQNTRGSAVMTKSAKTLL
jgi:hypothetical protein